MANKLFVGGFPYETSQDELAKLFSACGAVTDAKVIMDRETGRSKGFGFVEMATPAAAAAVIQKFNGYVYGGRKIFVTEARPQDKGAGGFAGKSGFSAKPGFVERRVGPRDRRRSTSGGGFGDDRKAWGAQSGGFGGPKKPWGDKKPGGFGGPKKSWGDKKPGGFGGPKKSWGDKKPGGFGGPKKSWGDKKPGGFGGLKKPWGGKKPGGFDGGKRRDG